MLFQGRIVLARTWEIVNVHDLISLGASWRIAVYRLYIMRWAWFHRDST